MDVNSHNSLAYDQPQPTRRLRYDKNWDFAAAATTQYNRKSGMTKTKKSTLLQQAQEHNNNKNVHDSRATRGRGDGYFERSYDDDDAGLSESELHSEMVTVTLPDATSLSSPSRRSSRRQPSLEPVRNSHFKTLQYDSGMLSDQETEYQGHASEYGLAAERFPSAAYIASQNDHKNGDALSLCSMQTAVREQSHSYPNQHYSPVMHAQSNSYAVHGDSNRPKKRPSRENTSHGRFSADDTFSVGGSSIDVDFPIDRHAQDGVRGHRKNSLQSRRSSRNSNANFERENTSHGRFSVDDTFSVGRSSIDVDFPVDRHAQDHVRGHRKNSLQSPRSSRNSNVSLEVNSNLHRSSKTSPRESVTRMPIPENTDLLIPEQNASAHPTAGVDGAAVARRLSHGNRSNVSALSGRGSEYPRRQSRHLHGRNSNSGETDSIGSASSIMMRSQSRASKSSGSKSISATDPDDEILVGPEKMLHDAARRGDVDTVERLLNDGVDIDCKNQTERTPLHLVAGNGHVLLLKLLLDRDASIEAADKFGMTALLWSAWFGHKETIQLLLRAGAKPTSRNKNGYTFLHCAAQNDHGMIEEILVEDLEDFDRDTPDDAGRTCLHVLAKNGRERMLERFIDLQCNVNAQDKAGNTPLHLAAKYGFYKLIPILTKGGADTETENSEGKTALHVAAEEGKVEATEHLIDEGADVNAETEEEMCPLHLAVNGGHDEVAIALMNGGADVDASNKHNQTPLHYAVLNRRSSLVQILILHKANPNVQDARQESPLHLATENGQPDITEMLLCSDVNLSLTDQRGKSPLDVAARGSFTTIVDMIIKAERHHIYQKALRAQGYISDNQQSILSQFEPMNISFKPDSSPETKHIREILYKLATKHLKRDEWRKLAFHWSFTDSQVRAIEEQYTGEKSYREHGHRMLLIWLNGCMLHQENPTKVLFEGLVAIQRHELAELMRTKANSITSEKGCIIS